MNGRVRQSLNCQQPLRRAAFLPLSLALSVCLILSPLPAPAQGANDLASRLAAAEADYRKHRDAEAAIDAATGILAENPSDPNIGAGALILKATAERRVLKDPAAAYATLARVAREFETSSRLGEALLLQIDCADEIPDADALEQAHDEIRRRFPNDAFLNATAEDKHAYFISVTGRNHVKAIRRWQTVADTYPQTTAAAEARITIACLAWDGDFAKANREMAATLESYPQLRSDLANYTRSRMAQNVFQLRDEEAARRAFKELDERTDLTARRRAEARMYLKGLSDHDSTERVKIVYTRALRQNMIRKGMDLAFDDLQEIIQKVHRRPTEAVRAALADTRPETREERAQLRYTACYGLFVAGRGREAYELAQDILDREQPEGSMKFHCLYMRAYLQGRGGDWNGAAAVWREVLAAGDKIDILPNAYLEYARALDMADRPGEALDALLDCIARFPYRMEADHAALAADRILLRQPELRPEVDGRQLAARTRWPRPTALDVAGVRFGDLLDAAADKDDYEQDLLAKLAGGGE